MKNFRFEAKAKSEDKDLKDIVRACGIEYPHHSLAFFSSIYACFEEANKNGVMLANSVKKNVPQLIGTQVNLEHMREKGHVVGTVLDAWVDGEQIKIAFSFYKSLYPDVYKEALEKMERGQLTVSFELKVEKDDIETLNNGVQKLKAVKFDGVGLLLQNRPACPEAIVYEQAKLESFISQDLIFAKTIQDKKLNKEGDKVDKKANDALLAKQKEIVIAEFGEEVVKDWTDEDFLSEEKIEALRLSTKESLEEAEVVAETEEPKEEVAEEVKEEATEEVKEDATEEIKEEVAEEKSEEAKTVIERETTVKETEEYDEEGNKTTVDVKEEVKIDGEPLVERTTHTEEKWFSSEEVEAIKAEYEAKISEKDSEIAFLRENAKIIAELKAELGDFVKDFSDEDFLNSDKVEIARLKSENQKLKEASQTLETASEEQAEEVKEEVKDAVKEELPTGHEEVNQEPELTSMQLVELAIKNRCKK